MSINPATYNIRLQRRADYELLLRFKDSTGADLDLTGWTVYAQAWNQNRTSKYADFSVSYVNRSEGRVQLTLTDSQTATFANEVFYDVLLQNTSGLLHYYLEGVIYVSEGYTAP
jgi:hypothetical protein